MALNEKKPLYQGAIMQIPDINDIRSMPQEELDALNKKLARKLAINMATLLWVKITVPRVAAVCLKHAAIRAAKNL
jgi:hypothetical protein